MTGIQRHWIVCLKRPDPDGGPRTEVRYASAPLPEARELATNHDEAFIFDIRADAEACAQCFEEIDRMMQAGKWRKVEG